MANIDARIARLERTGERPKQLDLLRKLRDIRNSGEFLTTKEISLRTGRSQADIQNACACYGIEYDKVKLDSICWDCDNWFNGCSWQRKFKPIEDWTAEKTEISYSDGAVVHSYFVKKCPQFKREGNKAKELLRSLYKTIDRKCGKEKKAEVVLLSEKFLTDIKEVISYTELCDMLDCKVFISNDVKLFDVIVY